MEQHGRDRDRDRDERRGADRGRDREDRGHGRSGRYGDDRRDRGEGRYDDDRDYRRYEEDRDSGEHYRRPYHRHADDTGRGPYDTEAPYRSYYRGDGAPPEGPRQRRPYDRPPRYPEYRDEYVATGHDADRDGRVRGHPGRLHHSDRQARGGYDGQDRGYDRQGGEQSREATREKPRSTKSRERGRAGPSPTECKTLLLTHLSPYTTEEDLTELVREELPAVRGFSVTVPVDQATGACTGSSTIEFSCLEDAMSAQSALADKVIKGSPFRLAYDERRPGRRA